MLDDFTEPFHDNKLQNNDTINKIDVSLSIDDLNYIKEAINKVLRCDESLSDKISYYTLFNYEGKNLVRKLSCSEAIKLQDQGGMDIR